MDRFEEVKNKDKWAIDDEKWCIKEIERLKKENKRLRKALEFYVETKKYHVDGFDPPIPYPIILDDWGIVAEKALKEK